MLLLFGCVLSTFLPCECQRPGVVALTFEDGPSCYTPEILSILKENNIKATFHFSTASMNESTASMIQAAAEDGHTVGLRTNPSRNYETISDKDAIYSDLDHQVSYIEDVSGEKVQFARSPLNSSNMPNEYVYDYFVENNIIMTQSAFSPYDAGTNPTEAVENHFRLLSPSFDSRIVSLYGSRLQEDEELQNIINVIRGNGFSFVTLEKCLPDYKPGDSAAAFSECKQSSSGAPTIINRGFITLLTYLAH